MTTKLLSKLFWMLAFFSFVLFIQLGDERENDSSSNSIEKIAIKPNKMERLRSQSPEFYASYQKVLQPQDDDSKLGAISAALAIADKNAVDDKLLLQQLNVMAGDIYVSRWHVVFALEKYHQALKHQFNQGIVDEIKRLEKYQAKIGTERSQYQDYIAYKNSGPSGNFSGKILVAYVFVDDGIKTRWSNKNKQQTLQTLALVQQWQKSKAAEYGINDIQFINKAFIAKRNPSLVNQKGVTFKSGTIDINQFAKSVVGSLGYDDIGSFIDQQIKEANADQGVIYFHSNFDQRSFARMCGYTHKRLVYTDGVYQNKLISMCREEFVMLTEKIKRNQWDKLHYTQAHETMHVFGAADLYNIEKAGGYAVTDIMNFQSKRLEYSTVEPITAYAIGWSEKPTDAPFNILER